MRILIVKLGAIGDVVHTLPAVAALRAHLPTDHIAWAVERGGAARLLAGTPVVDEVIELNLRGWRRSLTNMETQTEIRQAMYRLRKDPFDLSLDFQGLLKSAMVARLARVPRRIGFCREALREPAAAFLMNELVEVDDRQHIIRKHLQLVAHLGVAPPAEYQFPITLDPDDEAFAARQFEQTGGKYAILNPGGGWPTKLWSPAGFAAISDRLWQEFGIHSFITFGPGEESLAREVVDGAVSGHATLLDSTLKQFLALARQAKLFLGGDTGPMHLAAAARTPIVAIFGPTAAPRNGPFDDRDVIVERFDLDCRTDCYRRSCSHTSCMLIPVETVWQGVIKRLT
jgi:lipopolysaccharide heptosyltransferase I